MADRFDLVTTEDDEEVQYIVVDVPNSVSMDQFIAGQCWNIQDMHSESPRLHLPDGTTLHGEYDETLGTQMMFNTTNQQPANNPTTETPQLQTDPSNLQTSEQSTSDKFLVATSNCVLRFSGISGVGQVGAHQGAQEPSGSKRAQSSASKRELQTQS